MRGQFVPLLLQPSLLVGQQARVLRQTLQSSLVLALLPVQFFLLRPLRLERALLVLNQLRKLAHHRGEDLLVVVGMVRRTTERTGRTLLQSGTVRLPMVAGHQRVCLAKRLQLLAQPLDGQLRDRRLDGLVAIGQRSDGLCPLVQRQLVGRHRPSDADGLLQVVLSMLRLALGLLQRQCVHAVGLSPLFLIGCRRRLDRRCQLSASGLYLLS